MHPISETILWRRIDLPGHEIATLDRIKQGWKLSGTAVFLPEQGPTRLDYLVICDAAWQTSSARVCGSINGNVVDLAISANADHRWLSNGVECSAVEGCVDIDLGFSPSTNLLPIRRLGLGVGEEAAVMTAWLPFPSLKFELLGQRYRREADTIWHYESRGGLFMRTLEVNGAGFVTSYPDLWQAESACYR